MESDCERKIGKTKRVIIDKIRFSKKNRDCPKSTKDSEAKGTRWTGKSPFEKTSDQQELIA